MLLTVGSDLTIDCRSGSEFLEKELPSGEKRGKKLINHLDG